MLFKTENEIESYDHICIYIIVLLLIAKHHQWCNG
jgi:hypothetical protein